jgi:hypothetical protein
MALAQSPESSGLESKIGAVIAFASRIGLEPSYDENRLLSTNAIPSGLINLLHPTPNTLSDNRRFRQSSTRLQISAFQRHMVKSMLLE